MTGRRLILLCGEAEGDAFRRHAGTLAPDLEVQWVSSAASLDFATRRDCARTRLISFLTDVIVPEEILSRLGPVPYNIHPGPPAYPGSHGLSFAIFDGADAFGVTAHEMTAKVDAGPIVLVDRFSLPSDAELAPFMNEVYARAVALFDMVLRHCIATDAPMEPMDLRWSDRQCTRRRLRELMAAADLLLPHDRERLRRACGHHLDRAGLRHG